MADPRRNAVVERLRSIIRDSGRVKAALADGPWLEPVARAAECLVEALRQDRKILFFGNGGSAADAQHLATELVGRFVVKGRRALPALSLATDTSALTAIGNDFGYEQVFARQVEALGRAGDVAVGLTTSGRSKNVVLALRRARELGLKTVAMTGEAGGEAAEAAEFAIRVPSADTQRIQECHITLGHALCELIESALTVNQPMPPRVRSSEG